MKKLTVECLVVVVAALATACGAGEDRHQSGSSSSSGSSGNQQQCADVMCKMLCQNGFAPGPDGCPTCSCQPGGSSSGSTSSSSGGQTCPAIACAAYCPFGFAADAHGCATCQCLPGNCSSITDQDLCRNTASCVPVFEGTDPAGPGCAPQESSFQCCTQTESGVFCDGQPPPPPLSCVSDTECRYGERCDLGECPRCDAINGGACQVCIGRCVPAVDPSDCRTTGCGPGYACEGAGACPVVDCACRADAEDCNCPSPPPCDAVFQCVPVGNDCRTTGCGPGFSCQGVTACPDVACACPAGDNTCDCPPPPPCGAIYQCIPEAPPPECARVRCEANTQCVACAPNMDCIVHCVPVDQDCRSTGCGLGATCTEMSTCSGCACPVDDATCECAQATQPACMLSWQCVAEQDPCASLTQDQCSLHNNQCTPQYATVCADCARNDCDPACTETYVGCVSVYATGGGSTPPARP